MDATTPAASELLAVLRAWRQAHPDASFAEIEAAVEGELDRVRAQVLAQVAPPPAADERPCCRQCGGPMQARGTRERRLIVAGNQVVRLRRPYYWCPACAAGLFPPG